jgi:predicted nucleic acid-binding protein
MSDRNDASIDTNVILRYLLQDHPDHSPRAAALIGALRSGARSTFCPDTAIFETVHILHRRAGITRADVAHALTELVMIPGLIAEHEHALTHALAFWVEQPALDFADCYHLTLTRELGMSQIYTFDKKMDRYPGVERVEP